MIGICLCGAASGQTSSDNPRLKAALERYPWADSDKDGILTLEEANAFKIHPSILMSSRYIKLKLYVTLITLCTAASLAAEPGETNKPEARQATVTHPDLKAFPLAKAGMERFVIVLPRKEPGEEEALKVELIPGKMMETDGINLYGIAATLEEKNLEGWPYSFYEIGDGPVKMTMMRADPKAPPVVKFVQAQSLLSRYISNRPIVIYAPAGYEVHYRIWRADVTITPAPKG
jgi:ecotin